MHQPGYDVPVPVYLNETRRRNLTTIYLAAGTPESISRFKADATAVGLKVYTKADIMGAEEMADAVIDFQVLLHASYFATPYDNI
ncbi:hypothetical protein SEUCBS139899_008981 [Sporothrix eucalyptigena]